MNRCVVVVLMIFAVFAMSCEKMDANKPAEPSSGEGQNAEEQPANTVMNPGTVATIVIGETSFSVEIAESDAERARGLMNRESLAKNSGMWFIFSQEGDEKFWMKDTLISLDMIFVDKDMKVVHIIENAPAESTDLLGSPVPFQYVLEVSAGTASANGIKVGDKVEKRIGPQ